MRQFLLWNNKNKMDYEYIYAPDFFGDDNEKRLYGVQEVDDFPAYIEWFKTLEDLENNTKKYKFKVVNREEFLHSNGYYHITIKDGKD